jgi:Fe-S-cluster-containing dehydrogenase component/anaerobic selenocysteine-containing dehydrogenase
MKRPQEKKFWQSIEEAGRSDRRPAGGDEFPAGASEGIPLPSEEDLPSRRRFLTSLAASAALAAGVACSRGGQDTIVPYTKKSAEVIPGIADYYASTCQEGRVAYSVLVKTREGRPIHIDGNDEHPHFQGKTSLRVVSDIMGLYSPDRLKGPLVDGAEATWEEADAKAVAALKEAAAGKGRALLLTGAVLSPTRRALIADLKKALPSLSHVQWEPALSGAVEEAALALFGAAIRPRHRFDLAKVILCLDADVLGAEGNAVEAIGGFSAARRPTKPDEPMNRLYAFEGRMSLTGSKADLRVPMRPAGMATLAFALARTLHDAHGVSLPEGLTPEALAPFDLAAVASAHGLEPSLLGHLAKDLAVAGSGALVVAGDALPPEAHTAAALLNVMLGAEGYTVEAAFAPDAPPLASASDMSNLVKEMASGAFTVCVTWEVNPAYALPDAEAWKSASKQIPHKIHLGLARDETSDGCQVVLPVHHWLESWNDFEPSTDLLSLQQPVVGALYDTRQGDEILLGWIGALGGGAPAAYRDYLMARWKSQVYSSAYPVAFENFWNAALHDGVLKRDVPPRAPRAFNGRAAAEAAGRAAARAAEGGFELLLHPDLKVYDGRYADIAWLQELPDPVTKLTWGNAVAMSAKDAETLKVEEGDLVKVQAGDRSVVLPALVQPGQAQGVLSAALGYGRSAGSVAAGLGASLFPLAAGAGSSVFLRIGAAIAKADGHRKLIRTQDHFRMEGRDIVRQWTLGEYEEHAAHPEEAEHLPTLYPSKEFPVHKWGMAIDLSACVGCAGCSIACQSENNIPVVGPERVDEGREMHWIRIDRYYEGPLDNPKVAHQPMLCQQCDNAPCENVCPVAATTHSDEGLNQMAYNRCVGTRYCANNCPYKVRRFNYFDFTSTIKEPVDLAFNPEVTVRPRGVMEKCTFCVQRIQNGKQVAKSEGRALKDGEIKPACAMACPANAIVFGDLNDTESEVSRLSASNRGYKVLNELGTRPAVTYLADLKNPGGKGDGHAV